MEAGQPCALSCSRAAGFGSADLWSNAGSTPASEKELETAASSEMRCHVAWPKPAIRWLDIPPAVQAMNCVQLERAGRVAFGPSKHRGQGKQQKQQGLRAHSNSSLPEKIQLPASWQHRTREYPQVGHEGNGPLACLGVAIGKVDVSGLLSIVLGLLPAYRQRRVLCLKACFNRCICW